MMAGEVADENGRGTGAEGDRARNLCRHGVEAVWRIIAIFRSYINGSSIRSVKHVM